MIVDLRIWYTDFTGTEGSTGVLLTNASTFGQVDAFVMGFDAVIAGLTDAVSSKALAFIKLSPAASLPAVPPGTVRQNLTVLLANATRYASFNIPAPSTLQYLPTGPYAGFKVDMSIPAQRALFDALALVLADTVLPTGEPFPTGRVMAMLRRPPL